jgi:toxin YoeB
MIKSWDDEAWEDYCYWHTLFLKSEAKRCFAQTQDKKTVKRINLLIKDIDRHPHEGIGKPESLKYEYAGCWSRRIDDFNRIVYRIRDNRMEIIQCGAHYRDT